MGLDLWRGTAGWIKPVEVAEDSSLACSGVSLRRGRRSCPGQVHAVLALDLLDGQPVNDAGVPVVTAQTVVTVGGAHLRVRSRRRPLPTSSVGGFQRATEVEDEG